MSEMQRVDSTLAMKSILSAYGEDELIDDTERPDIDISGSEDEGPPPSSSSQPAARGLEDEVVSSREGTPLKMRPVTANRQRRVPATKLVSYGADDIEDEGDDDDEMEISDEDAEYAGQDPVVNPLPLVDYNMTVNESTLNESSESVPQTTETDHQPRIELPPEPTNKCSNKLQEKISTMYRKRGGLDLNASIQNRKDFRNPSIYEKLITYCNIDDKGTNYPPELFNPLIWGKESFYDELAKSQKVEMDKREKEKKERTKVEFVTGTKKQTSEGTVVEQKRKSKWDSQPASSLVSKPVVITTTVINPPVVSTTTSSAGVKTTVISATGTLKKPK